jgi:protein transport protein SEC61 subunit gamma-like protein
MEAVDTVVRPMKDFAKDSIRLVKRCHKPDQRGSLPRFRFSNRRL